MFYEDVFRALQKEKIEYVIVGGLAVALHGVVRLTADLDVAIALDEKNILKFVSLLTKLKFKPKVPVKPEDFADPQKRKNWIQKKHMKVFSFYHHQDTFKMIDVFVKEYIPFKKLYNDRKTIIIENGLKIPICSVKHLVQLKEKAGRPQDLADIAALKRLRS